MKISEITIKCDNSGYVTFDDSSAKTFDNFHIAKTGSTLNITLDGSSYGVDDSDTININGSDFTGQDDILDELLDKYETECSGGGGGGGSTSDDISNESSVSGTTVTDALETLNEQSGFITKTVAEMQALAIAGTLIKGQKYFISNGATGKVDNGILAEGASNKRIKKIATGLFLNADWQIEGDYSGVEDITGIPVTSNKGMWQPTSGHFTYITGVENFTPGETIAHDGGQWTARIYQTNIGSYTFTGSSSSSTITVQYPGTILYTDFSGNRLPEAGDTFTGGTSGETATVETPVVDFDNSELGSIWIWHDGTKWVHYQKKTADYIILNPVSDATANYTRLLTTDDNQGYIAQADEIGYDLTRDFVTYRKDALYNNHIENTGGDFSFLKFPFGWDNIKSVRWNYAISDLVINDPYFSCIEFTFGFTSVLYVLSMVNNLFGGSLGTDSVLRMTGAPLEAGGENPFGSNHANLTIGNGCYIITNGKSLDHCVFGNRKIATLFQDHVNKSWIWDESTFEAVIDMSNPNFYDSGTQTLILANLKYCGDILILGSNDRIIAFDAQVHTGVTIKRRLRASSLTGNAIEFIIGADFTFIGSAANSIIQPDNKSHITIQALDNDTFIEITRNTYT